MLLNYYLVEITLPQSLYSDFLNWLNPHRLEMESLPCFTGSQLFSELSPRDNQSIRLEVRYFYESEKDLDLYLKNWAPQMRTSLPSQFKDQISFRRYQVQAKSL